VILCSSFFLDHDEAQENIHQDEENAHHEDAPELKSLVEDSAKYWCCLGSNGNDAEYLMGVLAINILLCEIDIDKFLAKCILELPGVCRYRC
jgi:hypothetical protein